MCRDSFSPALPNKKMARFNTSYLCIRTCHIEALKVVRSNTNINIGITMCHFFLKKRYLVIPIPTYVLKRPI